MLPVFIVTLRGIFRDRVFHGILMTSILLLFIPSISNLSMRQVTELTVTLSLSLISFILLLLAVFLGATAIWKDIERRYIFSVVGLPISRHGYIAGKFAGIAGFILLTSLLLGFVACAVVWFAIGSYPPLRPVVWSTLFLAIVYDALKYILLVAISFLLSTVSTSFFLPIFGTIATFLVGSASQQVYDYVNSPAAASLSPVLRWSAFSLYYILPNFSAFDLKVNAVYSIAVSPQGLSLTLAYCVVYISIVIFLASIIFSRRELK